MLKGGKQFEKSLFEGSDMGGLTKSSVLNKLSVFSFGKLGNPNLVLLGTGRIFGERRNSAQSMYHFNKTKHLFLNIKYLTVYLLNYPMTLYF